MATLVSWRVLEIISSLPMRSLLIGGRLLGGNLRLECG
jgi:hypothetical protein